jgi:hypothetical protein
VRKKKPANIYDHSALELCAEKINLNQDFNVRAQFLNFAYKKGEVCPPTSSDQQPIREKLMRLRAADAPSIAGRHAY